MKNTSIIIRRRIIVLLVASILIFFLLITRLVWIQFIQGDELSEKASSYRMRKIPEEAKRGSIYDRNMNELVSSISASSIYITPSRIKDKEKTAKLLASLLDMDEKALLDKMNKNTYFEWIKRKVDWDTAKKIRELQIDGVGFVEESRRFYRQGTLAAHLLGFVGIDNQGLIGIEKTFDEELKGVPGYIVIEHDAVGREIPQALHRYVAPRQGYNLILTLDKTVQYFVERELDRIVEEFDPTSAVIIVMNPKTGEIIALGVRPTFNPNMWQDYESCIWDRNMAIWYNYEPGSTFKIITAAIALEEKKVSMEDYFYCSGNIKISDRRIRCWECEGHGSQSFKEVVKNSCNPGFIEIGLRLGIEQFYSYLRNFGFGDITGIELPGEAKGIVINEKKATNLNLAIMSIGHSIAVTPIQIITAVSAVINGGYLVKPYIVKEIRDENNKVIKENKPQKIRQVISESTSLMMRKLLENVVLEGTGKNAYIEGYSVGGKTGTAQVVDEDGGYADGKYVSSFVGFAPVDDPCIIVLVMVQEPKGDIYYGSEVAAPVFARLARDILRYMGIPKQIDIESSKEHDILDETDVN